MKAKHENRFIEQKNFSSHYRIYRLRNWIVLMMVLMGIVGLISYLTGVSVVYVAVGLWVAKSVLRAMFSIMCRLVVFAVVVLLLFSILMH